MPNRRIPEVCSQHVVALNGHAAVLDQLYKRQSFDLETSDSTKRTALLWAAERGREAVVKWLFDAGANVNAQGGVYGNAVRAASAGGHEKVVQMLVEQQADVNAKSDDGSTPLHLTAQYGHLDVVKFLVEQQACVNATDNDGWITLHLATESGHLDVVKFLVEQQADVNAMDNSGWTALHLAAINGHLDVVKFLVELKGVISHISARDTFWRTPIHVAIYSNQTEVAKVLIEHGADLSVIDGYGKTALDWASAEAAIFYPLGKSSYFYVPTPEAVRIKTLWRSVRQLSENLLKTKRRRMSPGFHELGHCLLFLQQLDEACLSFQQQIAKLNSEGSHVHQVVCDICEEWDFSGSRFVCKTCPDIDTCSACMPKYHEAKTLACHNHEFFDIFGSPPDCHKPEGTDVISGDVQEWLERLMLRYGEAGPSCSSSTFTGAHSALK